MNIFFQIKKWYYLNRVGIKLFVEILANFLLLPIMVIFYGMVVYIRGMYINVIELKKFFSAKRNKKIIND